MFSVVKVTARDDEAGRTDVYDGVLPVQRARDHVKDGQADGGDDGGPGLALSAPHLGQLGKE